MTASVPLERAQPIRLPVRLAHRIPSWWTMLLDTGSVVTVVAPEVAEEIGLELRESPGLEIVGIAGSATAAETTTATISLLGMTVRSVDVICLPLDPRLGVDGILGLDFLQHFNIRIDNDSETITFELRPG